MAISGVKTSRITRGNDDGVIFIGLDEANYLLDSGYTGEEEKHTFLKETLLALGSAMLSRDKFVFAMVESVKPIDETPY